MNFKKICIVAVLSNDDIISSRPCLKTGVKNDFFWSEIGSAYTIPDSTSKNFLDCGFNKQKFLWIPESGFPYMKR